MPDDSETYEEDLDFVTRLQHWLLEQPEYLSILALDRPQRRSGLRRVANIILTFPEADVKPRASRVEQRAAVKALRKQVSKKLDAAQSKKSRKQREIDAATKRIRRLTQKRLDFLVERETERRAAEELVKQAAAYEANLLTDEHRQQVLEASSEHDPALD